MIDIQTIHISPELLSLIAEVDEFRGKWRALHNLAPDRLALLRKIATIESVGSSTRIEGAKLSDKEVEALLSRLNSDSFRSRDEEEVAGYAEVMEQIFMNYTTIPFTENYIKQLHSTLLKYSTKDTRHRGEYKKFPNHVEAFDESGKSIGIVFKTTTPFKTPLLMEQLINWTQQALLDKSLHPLLVIGIFIVWFLAIHPFQDGNGRLSRVLTSLLLLKSGYIYVPYSSLESIVEENKENYYLALRRSQSTLEDNKIKWEPWLKFFLHALKKQKDHLEKKLEKENIFRTQLSPLGLKIIELSRHHGQITISQLSQLTHTNRNTLKAQLRQLVKEGYLVLHGRGRATWYTLS